MKYQGGIVFYVEDEDKKGCGKHGLIEAMADLGTSTWAYSQTQTFATANGLYAGEKNTTVAHAVVGNDPLGVIDQISGAINLAFKYMAQEDGTAGCLDSTQACYGDWYLPSLHELQLMQKMFSTKNIGNFTNSAYWSSTEAVAGNKAFLVIFSNGTTASPSKSQQVSVRPIREF